MMKCGDCKCSFLPEKMKICSDFTKDKTLTDREKHLIEVYADNDMNVSKTAKALFYHRNTIEYDFNRIEEKTGCNPRRFWDLAKLISEVEDGTE